MKIVDRKKDMIIVSGFNVYPTNRGRGHSMPGGCRMRVHRRADDKTGEGRQAVVVKAPNATLTNEDLVTHCRKEMTRTKCQRLCSS